MVVVVSLLLLVDVSDVGREDAGAGVQEAVAELGEGEAAEPSSTSMGNLPTNITYNNIINRLPSSSHHTSSNSHSQSEAEADSQTGTHLRTGTRARAPPTKCCYQQQQQKDRLIRGGGLKLQRFTW